MTMHLYFGAQTLKPFWATVHHLIQAEQARRRLLSKHKALLPDPKYVSSMTYENNARTPVSAKG